jgi:endonuclease III related protein
VKEILDEIYRRLRAYYGPTGWWPGETPFEIAAGAILTQNAAWVNVEKAIENLKTAGLLDPARIVSCCDEKLYAALRPSGYFRVKAARLRAFCGYLTERYRGDMQRMARRPLGALRPELLAVPGIGPETADDILLYACSKPVFVVDAYTRRILSRHGLLPAKIGYEALRHVFEDNFRSDVGMFQEYHGLIVWAGKEFCRRTPRCAGCPLEPMLDGRPPSLDSR